MSLTRKGRLVVVLLIFAFFFGGAALGGYLYLRSIGVYGTSAPGDVVAVTIPKGTNAAQVGEILLAEGIIDSTLGWKIATYLEGGADGIQAGDYQLRQGLTPRDALRALLEQGPAGEEFDVVTFQEGLWLTEFAAKIEAATDLSGDRFLKLLGNGKIDSPLKPDDIDSMEGLLFPSTYQVAKSENERRLGQKLADQMVEQVEQLDLSRAKEANLSEYDVIIIASMIEAETRVDEERPMVARVIWNRLSQGIALGIDATYLYELKDRNASLTQSILQTDSPYNLRTRSGLPPTPIGAPGAESLEAAADPADGDWIYYVLADCDGNHAFSVTNSEFLQDKAAFQRLEC
ncbi:MAG: endolytic transglycosylase MltG [Actinomycetota bacterium]